MLAKPSWWLENEIRPVVEKFEADPMSKDLARLAVFDMCHFADRVFEFCKQQKVEYLEGRSVEKAIQQVNQSNPALTLIARVANASKHHLIKRKNVQYAASGQFTGRVNAVWICDENGQARWTVVAALWQAMEFWRRWLQTHPDA